MVTKWGKPGDWVSLRFLVFSLGFRLVCYRKFPAAWNLSQKFNISSVKVSQTVKPSSRLSVYI